MEETISGPVANYTLDEESKKILITLAKVEEYVRERMVQEKEDEDSLDISRAEIAYQAFCNGGGSSQDRVENSCVGFYRKHLMNLNHPVPLLKQLFESFYKASEDEAADIFKRWRDAIPFVRGQILKNLLAVFTELVFHSKIRPKYKFSISIELFERGFIECCYDMFLSLLGEEGLSLFSKAECCKYLYLSQKEEYQEKLLSTLKGIFKESSLTSSSRIQLLAALSGPAVKLQGRGAAIFMERNIPFLVELHQTFVFESKDRELDDVITACIFLLKNAEEEVTEKTEALLFDISKQQQLSEGLRASALDAIVVSSKNREKAAAAFMMLKDMGFNTTTKKFKTIYDSSQNVHSSSVTDSVNKAIVRLVKEESSVASLDIKKILKKIEPLLEKEFGERKHKIRKSLNRILVDSSIFTDLQVSLPEIFCAVWNKIHTFPNNSDYIIRLFDEMESMDETCSSGYSSRLINVLAGEYDVVQISWEEQIKSNIAGRMFKLLKDMPDGDEKDLITLGIMEGSEEEEAQAYRAFMEKNRTSLYEELKGEFVGMGYMSLKEFDPLFEKGFSF